jgi:cell wall-associated NlpC family hydrolase
VIQRSRFSVLRSRFVFPPPPKATADLAEALRAEADWVRGSVLWAVVLGALATGCATRGTTAATPRPFPGATVPPRSAPAVPASEPLTPAGRILEPAVISLALSLQGTPYRNGGSDPSGFDCSGFVQWVFAQNGLALPREVKDQYRAGSEIDSDDIRPGDLVFFETVSSGASHVGIALGGGEFVHAPSSRGVVRIERYTSRYWTDRWVGARRIAAADAPAS